MNKIQVCLVIGMAVIGAAACRADTKTTYRDAQGRIRATKK